MSFIASITQILSLALFIVLALSAGYILIYSLFGLLYREKQGHNTTQHKIVVLIPGYKEDAVIVGVAEDALKQDYPSDRYDVVIIADSFQKETLEKLGQLPIRLIEVSFEKSTKSKALNKAMELLPNDYDIAVILDADNLMEKDFLTRVNKRFTEGVKVLQGHRMAKNTNTSFAVLDAVSEEINNHIFRKGHRAAGLSAALIGSAMAFQYSLFKEYMSRIKAIGGFDKELELNLLRDRIRIHYLNDAKVYDEKVSQADNFKGQRKRWLAAQFIYFGRFVGSGLQHLLLRGNIDFFDKVIQMILLPRILLLGLLLILTIILSPLFIWGGQDIFNNWIKPDYSLWIAALAATALAMLLSIPRKFHNTKTLRAILELPKGFLLMFLTLLNLKGANKKFIHTKHG